MRTSTHGIGRNSGIIVLQHPTEQYGDATTSASRAIVVFFAVLSGAAFFYVLLFEPSPTQQLEQIVAAGLLLPFLIVAKAFNASGSLRYVVLIGLLFINYIYFCGPFIAPDVFLEPVFMGARFDPDKGMFVLAYASIFLLSAALGYLPASRFTWRLLMPLEEERVSVWVMRAPATPIMAGMLVSLVALNYYWDYSIGGGSFVGSLVRLFFPVFYLLFLLRDRSFLLRAAASVLYVAYYPMSISAGLLAPWMVSNGLIVAGLLVVRRRLSWVLVVVGIIGVVPLLGVKGEYRDWRREGTQSTRLEGGLRFLQLSLESIGRDAGVVERDETVSRFSMGPIVFSRVVQAHELRAAEFQFGSTFADLPLVLLPRVVFPWKPEKTTGQWFGHAYGFLAPDNFNTSVNLPPIVEAYVNFGELGAPVIGLMIGVVWGAMFSLLGGGRSLASGLLIGLVFSTFLNAESSISIVYGQAFQIILCVWLLFWAYRTIGGARHGAR